MNAVTKLCIYFRLREGASVAEALGDLPSHSRESFFEHAPGAWCGDFVVSCPQAPELAEGDFVDDFAPYFPALLKLKHGYGAEFELQIAVGAPGPEEFELSSNLLALLAALGAILRVTTSSNPNRVEQERE